MTTSRLFLSKLIVMYQRYVSISSGSAWVVLLKKCSDVCVIICARFDRALLGLISNSSKRVVQH